MDENKEEKKLASPADSPQCQSLLNYMREHRHGITTFEAVLKLRITDPRKRMSEIRKDPRYTALVRSCPEVSNFGKRHNRWWIEEDQVRLAI